MADHVETLPRRERDSKSTRQDTTIRPEQGSDSAPQRTKGTIGFPREYSSFHLFCITFNNVVEPGSYFIASSVLRSVGRGRTLVALFVLGLVAFAINRGQAQMLSIWRIRSSTIHFPKIFIDAGLGVVTGWFCCAVFACCYTGLTLLATTLIDALGLGRAGCFFANVTAHTVPVLLALMPNNWFKCFQIGLTGFKGFVVVAIGSIMVYIEESTVYRPTKFMSQEDATISGSLVHTYIIRILHAMFMLCPFCFGMQAMSVVAPEMMDEQQVPSKLGGERVSTSSRCLDKY